jgi:hypothetical protein
MKIPKGGEESIEACMLIENTDDCDTSKQRKDRSQPCTFLQGVDVHGWLYQDPMKGEIGAGRD